MIKQKYQSNFIVGQCTYFIIFTNRSLVGYGSGSEVQISHKTSKNGLKNIQKSIAELSPLAAVAILGG